MNFKTDEMTKDEFLDFMLTGLYDTVERFCYDSFGFHEFLVDSKYFIQLVRDKED